MTHTKQTIKTRQTGGHKKNMRYYGGHNSYTMGQSAQKESICNVQNKEHSVYVELIVDYFVMDSKTFKR